MRPLFSGTSTLSQLEAIISFTGKPSTEDVQACLICPTTLELLSAMFGSRTPGEITTIIPRGSLESHDLLRLLLQFLPDKRISAADALEHPYVGHFHSPDEEPSFPRPLNLSLDDNVQYSVNAYRDYVYAEVIGDENSVEKVALARKERKIQILERDEQARLSGAKGWMTGSQNIEAELIGISNRLDKMV